MEEISINTEKYSKFILDIEKFIEVKKKQPITFNGVVEKIDLSNNNLTIRLQSTKRPYVSEGSSILIREDTPESMNTDAVIEKFYNSDLKVKINTNPLQFENKKVVIDIEKINVILKRLHNVIGNIKNGKISLDNERILDFMINKRKPEYSNKRVFFISRGVNEDQKESVVNSIQANDFHLIIGPPGTGKTYVIEELISQFVKRNQKVLITAWTNLAVDNMIKRMPKKESINVVRIGPIDKTDPEVRKFSIFERMKEHVDWKEVERYRKLIEDLSNTIPMIGKEKDFLQKNIDQCMSERNIIDRETGKLITEKQKYDLLISRPDYHEDFVNIMPVNDEMTAINEKSQICLSLSKNILQMNNLQSKIPEDEYVENIKKLTKKMKLLIIGKSISSFFSNNQKKELNKLKNEYEENKRYLDEVLKLKEKYNNLKKLNESKFKSSYPDRKGYPDKDALNLEFKAYNILQDKYIPLLMEQEKENLRKHMSDINQEVYKIYIETLKRKIELFNVRRESLNTDLYIKINHKKDLDKQYLNGLYSQDIYKKNIDRLIKRIVSDIIEKAKIIAATVISSGHHFLDRINFDVTIMDEATQVASFMSLLPLLKCKKFVLVGDNKQLQPIEDDDISQEMNLSIFNRLFEMYPEASTILQTQYRMHKTIAQIASEIFYEGRLRTSEEVAERILSLKVDNPSFLNPKMPVMFIDTSKAGYYEDELGSSCSNTKEAEYVAYIVSLFVKHGINKKDIGVITPYVKQKNLIEEFLTSIKTEDIEVNTIHKFQGREKDIIIVSFAKSYKYAFPQSKLRFIEDGTLINVSITRAKKKLILIGNSNTLCQSKLLHRVIDKIGEKNRITL